MDTEDRIHVWLARFPDAERAQKYFEEEYGDGEDDDVPISAFARDQGVFFYDHDWLQFEYDDRESLSALIERHVGPVGWADEALRQAASLGADAANTLVLIDVDEIDEPRSVDGPDYALRYAGSFERGMY